MPPKKQQEYHFVVKSKDQLDDLLNNKKLTIVDVHLSWCGPCTLLASTYRSIAMKIDDWDTKIQFLIADVGDIPELAPYQNSCKPKFLFYLNGKIVAEVSGVNVPKIVHNVNRYLPAFDQD